jgi:3D (Asp-Asp-Asp) domain-containing protein
VKALREGPKRARRWFWAQVCGTLYVSIKEGIAERLTFGKAVHWCRRLSGGLAILFSGNQILGRSPIGLTSFSLALSCLLALYTFNLQRDRITEEQLAQLIDPSEQSRTEVKRAAAETESVNSDALEDVAPNLLGNSKGKARTITADDHQMFVATAYSIAGRMAGGAGGRSGLIAADRRMLPLGTRVHLEAGAYSGEYMVADRGSAARGRMIDIWVPSTREAMRFGRRPVRLTVLSYGARPSAWSRPTRDIPAQPRSNADLTDPDRTLATASSR